MSLHLSVCTLECFEFFFCLFWPVCSYYDICRFAKIAVFMHCMMSIFAPSFRKFNFDLFWILAVFHNSKIGKKKFWSCIIFLFLAPPLEELYICNSHSLPPSHNPSLRQIFTLALFVSLSITLLPPGYPWLIRGNLPKTQDDPWMTQDDPRVTQDDPWVARDDPKVTQENPRMTHPSIAVYLVKLSQFLTE